MPGVRHGSRWLHDEPDEEQVREWFKNQPLHPSMSHEPYVGGIVLIGATEKVKVTMEKADGAQYVRENERVVYVPYVKVDTRIAYFWDLARAMNEAADDDRYVGVIEPVSQRRITDENSPYFNGHLPEGFTVLPIKNENNSVNRYLVGTYSVAIWERQSYARVLNGDRSFPVLSGVGSKQTALTKKWADDNVVMKAETGAIGRALGVAGILVVGTGVATAEDMQEAAQGPAGAAGSTEEGPTLPAIEGGGGFGQVEEIGAAVEAAPAVERETTAAQDDEALRAAALAAQKELEADYPEVWAEILTWWKGRKFGRLSELNGPALKGAVIKLQRDLDTAKSGSAGMPGEGDTPYVEDPTAEPGDES